MRNQVAFVFAVLLSAFVVAPQAADAQSLTGVVYAPGGAVLAEKDVTIVLRWEASHRSLYRATKWGVRTDADGRYRVDDVGAGPVSVTAMAAEGWAALGDLAMGAGDDPIALDVNLRDGATLEVQVLDMRRRPVPGAEFTLGGPFHAWRGIPCTADGEGRAVVRHLAPGYYNADGFPWQSALTLLGPGDHAQVTLFTDPTAGPAVLPPAMVVHPWSPLAGVVLAPDGSPVSLAKVYVDYFPFDNPNMLPPQGLALTDAEGQFAFDDIVQGYHWLAVAKDDAPLGFFPFYAPGPDEGRTPVSVALPGERGALTGVVIDPVLGGGVANAEVIVAERAPLSPGSSGEPQPVDLSAAQPIGGMEGKPADVSWRAESGADGRYEFTDLLPGEYTVITRANGAQTAQGGVVIEPGQTTSIPPLRPYAKDALKVTGRVTSEDAPEKGLAGIEVTVSTSGTYEPSMGTVTDANGAFAIPVERPGWYPLSASGVDVQPSVYYGAVVRSDGRPEPVDIVLPRGTTGHGTASVLVVLPTGQPPAGRVWVVPLQICPTAGPDRPRPRFDLLAYTDDQGACTLDRLPPGRYRFFARTEVDAGPDAQPPVQGTSEEIVVSSGGVAEAVAVLESPGRIVGKVTREDGSAAGGMMVGMSSIILPWQFMPPDTRDVTDETGSFVLGPVEPGGYFVAPVAWQPRPDGSAMPVHLMGEQVLLSPGQTATAELKLARIIEPAGTVSGSPPVRMTITGTVAYADGAPAAGVQVSLPDADRVGLSPTVLADGMGRFRLTVFQGQWPTGIAAWAPGYAESWLELYQVAKPDHEGPVEGVELKLGRGGSVTGSIILPDDDPAEGDLVAAVARKMPVSMMGAAGMPGPGSGPPLQPRTPGTASRPSYIGAQVTMEADGSFRADHLTPGDYVLNVTWGKLGRCEPVEFEVQEGVPTDAGTLVASALVPLASGLVVNTDGVTPAPCAAVELSGTAGSVPAEGLRTDPGGAFRLHCLPEGAYKVNVRWPGATGYAWAVPTSELTVSPDAGEDLLMVKEMITIRGKVLTAPGLTLPPGLRVALTSGGPSPTWAVVTAPVAPDGAYVINFPKPMDFEQSLVMGHCTRIASQKLTLAPGAETVAPDLVWTGVVSEQ